MRYYYLEKTYLYVGFDYDPTILAELKRIGGFLYNPQNKEWYKEVSLDTGTVIEHFFKKYDFKYGRPQVKEPILDLPKYDEVISMEDLGRMIDGLNLKRKPRNYQLEGIHYMINHPNCVNGCDMGLGKAQPNDLTIITPNGPKKFGELAVGDELFGSDGGVQQVEEIYERGGLNCYRVTFSDGSNVECCDEHLWKVFHNKKWQIFPLKEIMNRKLRSTVFAKDRNGGVSNHGNYLWSIPLISKPVEFPYQKVEIDPYTLGALLGDGSFRRGTPSFTTGDDEIIRNLILPPTCELKESKRSGNAIDYNIISTTTGKNDLNNLLEKYNLRNKYSYEKEIPESYIFNTAEIRLGVLQGLLDTDGYVSKSGLIEFACTSKRLVEQVAFIVKSLGGTANKLRTKPSHYCNNGVRINCRDHYRIGLNLPENIIPCRLSRKVTLIRSSRKMKPSRYIRDISYVGMKSMRCIRVSNPDHLYACNEDFILTHNTGQAIVLAETLELFPCLVVTPASVKYGWRAEWDKWVEAGKRKIQVLESKSEWLPGQDVYIMNYDILYSKKKKEESDIQVRFRELFMTEWAGVFLDEAHMCKNDKSIRSKMVKKLVPHADLIYPLTGTLILNRPAELINILNITGWFPKLFSTWQDFVYRYCNAKRRMVNGQLYGWDVTCASNTLELNRIISNSCYFRKEKREVLTELPPMIEQVVEMGCSNKREYKKAENDLIDYLSNIDVEKAEKAENALHLVKLNTLKELSVKGKMKDIEVFLNEWKEISEDKLLVFGVRREPLKRLADKYKAPIIQGGMSAKAKFEVVQSFKTDDQQFLFANIDAVGTGTDGLQECCSNLAYIELPDRFAILDQANSRLERMGQKNSINVFYLLCRETIDQDVSEMLEAKKRVTNAVNKGIDVDVSGIDINYMLLNRMKNRVK